MQYVVFWNDCRLVGSRNISRSQQYWGVVCYARYISRSQQYCSWLARQWARSGPVTFHGVIHAWSPYLEKDITCLERVQGRATELVHGLKNKCNEGRPRFLGMYPLQKRMLMGGGDLIETFKILTGRDYVEKVISSYLQSVTV